MRKYVTGLAAVLLPSVLLYPDGIGFARDWANHVWMVGYVGEYIRQHHSFPAVANTAEVGGIAFPVFYGYLFYPLLGLAATHLHPEIVVRGAALLMLAAQYVCVRKTMRRLKASEGLAAGTACLVIWSIYGLTNLYSRAALTEFFAVGVLTCAVCSWFDMLRSSPRALWRRGLRFGLLLTLAMGFHPITGVYSLPLLGVLLFALPGRTVSLKRLVPVCGVAGVAAVLVLAPWVYAVRYFEADLSIAHRSNAIADCSAHLDRWQTRLNPLPTDIRLDDDAPKDVSTPYLDCQIGYPLLVLAVGVSATLLGRTAGRTRLAGAALMVVPLAYALTFIYLSTHVKVFDDLPDVFKKVQFLYRLVSYVNIGFLLVPMFGLLWVVRGRPDGAPPVTVSPVLLTFVLTYAGVCVGLKLQHAEVARIPSDPVVKMWAAHGRVYQQHANNHRRWVKNHADRDALGHLPMASYGHNDYVTTDYLTPLSPAEEAAVPFKPFGVETKGGHFGENHRLTVTTDQPGYVATEILVFPWNRFEIDGQVIPREDLRSWNSARVNPDLLPPPWTAIPVPAGTHTIQYRFEPNVTWRVLSRVSRATLFLWILVTAGLTVANLVRVKHTPAIPPDVTTVLVQQTTQVGRPRAVMTALDHVRE